MNKKELSRRIAAALRDQDIRKSVSAPKKVFHISDDEGNQKDFILKTTEKRVLFTVDDVEAIIDTCIEVIIDALKHGDPVTIRGFGTLGLKYRKGRTLKHVETGEEVEASSRFLPKFSFGSDLRMAAKLYELSLGDLNDNANLPIFYGAENEAMTDGD